MKSALFIRLDRMGDLVLTLPCDRLVDGDYKVHWLIPKGLEFVVEHSQIEKKFTPFSKDWSWKNFWQLRQLIKKLKPDASVSFHVPWWINFALWSCGVPLRGGVLSQWHSYLFLNKGLRQKRSRVEAHEMEYNFQLVEYIFGLKRNRELWLPLQLIEPEQQTIQFDMEQKYFVVHPGMGGSALNWPTASYAQLINQLSEHTTVVVTGTKSDETYLSPLKKTLKENHRVVWLDKQLGGPQLLKLLNNATAVIAPSTGVLHLSASLGAPSLGIFSPILVHQEKRWGAKGVAVSHYSPPVKCPAQFECLKEQCPHYDCMEKISPQTVAQKALSYL